MTKPKLHLDADASDKALWKALKNFGHDVTRTPQPGLPLDARDDEQLRWASQQGRIHFTYNIPDFIKQAEMYTSHSGILLVKQKAYSLSQLITLLDRAIRETTAEEWIGGVRWLSD